MMAYVYSLGQVLAIVEEHARRRASEEGFELVSWKADAVRILNRPDLRFELIAEIQPQEDKAS